MRAPQLEDAREAMYAHLSEVQGGTGQGPSCRPDSHAPATLLTVDNIGERVAELESELMRLDQALPLAGTPDLDALSSELERLRIAIEVKEKGIRSLLAELNMEGELPTWLPARKRQTSVSIKSLRREVERIRSDRQRLGNWKLMSMNDKLLLGDLRKRLNKLDKMLSVDTEELERACRKLTLDNEISELARVFEVRREAKTKLFRKLQKRNDRR